MLSTTRFLPLLAACLTMLVCAVPSLHADPPKLSVLFLGDAGHHRPADMAKILTPVLAKVGIDVTYTPKVEALTPARLAKLDAVLIFRDSGDLPAKEEAALLEFVES